MMRYARTIAVGLALIVPARSVSADERYDGLQALLDDEAREALGAGKYERAWLMFWRLLRIDPDDAHALREAGRVAQALGRYEYAIEALGRVSELRSSERDPEIHFLRGEALLAVGRRAEGLREFERAEAEIGDNPTDRRERLWLARICALRKQLRCARRIYQGLVGSDVTSDEYADVMLSLAEAEALSASWRDAERTVRRLLAEQPEHRRGREMLAWALEGQGRIDQEVAIREGLASEWGDHARKTVEYGRALERNYAYALALKQYREARSLGVLEVEDDIQRVELIGSPEVAGGLRVREDPSGTVTGAFAAASIPLSDSFRMAVVAAGEAADTGVTAPGQRFGSLTAWGSLLALRGGVIAAGVTAHERSNGGSGLGGTAVVRTSPAFAVQLHARGEVNVPWRESASTIRQGGVSDAAELQTYVTGRSRRVVFSAAAQGRRLTLAPMADMDEVHALQLLGALGVDVVLTANPERVARGELLDDELLSRVGLADSIVLSYRHYEIVSDDPFGSRLVLVERSSADELTGTIRRVVDEAGVVAGELRGGGGYDNRRSVMLWRAGGSILVSATVNSRFVITYDIASESGTGLDGRRSAGSMTLHVDL